MRIFESEFPDNFREEEIQKILNFVTTGKFCQLICIPGVGKATILRLLAHNRSLLKHHLKDKEKNMRFIYLNFFELTSFDEAQIIKFLLLALDETPISPDDPLILKKQINEAVNKMAGEDTRLVFLFDHFDEYQNRLPRSFFQLLKSLHSLAKYRFTAVFATRRDLTGMLDQEIIEGYWDFFVGNSVYLKVFDERANEFMFKQIEKVFEKKVTQEQKSQITALCGGHAKLTKISCELLLGQDIEPQQETLSKEQTMQAALYEIWLFLTPQEQQEILNLSRNNKPQEGNLALESLVKFNLIAEKSFDFTIPIFADFVKTLTPTLNQKITFDEKTRQIIKGQSIISELLSPQEFKLLSFLLNNPQRVIERDEIITAVWPENQVQEAVSDEAIDQMIFRLRKKIEEEPASPSHILTVKGRGIRFQP